MPVGKGRVRPQHIASGRGVGRLQQMGAADLLVVPGAKPGDDQVAVLGGQKETVAVLDDKDVRGADLLAVRRGRGPETFARGGKLLIPDWSLPASAPSLAPTGQQAT